MVPTNGESPDGAELVDDWVRDKKRLGRSWNCANAREELPVGGGLRSLPSIVSISTNGCFGGNRCGEDGLCDNAWYLMSRHGKNSEERLACLSCRLVRVHRLSAIAEEGAMPRVNPPGSITSEGRDTGRSDPYLLLVRLLICQRTFRDLTPAHLEHARPGIVDVSQQPSHPQSIVTGYMGNTSNLALIYMGDADACNFCRYARDMYDQTISLWHSY